VTLWKRKIVKATSEDSLIQTMAREAKKAKNKNIPFYDRLLSRFGAN
jgi:hypothetical protein